MVYSYQVIKFKLFHLLMEFIGLNQLQIKEFSTNL